MIDEVKLIEPQLKQILYECVEYVQATKAALYLNSSSDLNEKKFELVTSYQYNVGDRKVVGSNDDLVDRLSVKRNAFFVNGVATDQRFAEMLFRQGNDRLLATPIFAQGRLVGFIDMRDKAGKKPFDTPDLDAARRIAEEMLQLLSARKLYGLEATTVIESLSQAPSSFATPPAQARPSTPPPPQQMPAQPIAGNVFTAQAMAAIEAARDFLTRKQHSGAGASTGKRSLTETDLEAIRLLLPSALSIPGAVFATLTLNAQGVRPLVAAVATVSEDALQMLQSHLHARTGGRLSYGTPQSMYPFGVQVVPITAQTVSTIISAAVNPNSIEGLTLTVGFERTSEAHAQRVLQIFLKQIESPVEVAINATAGRVDKQVIAEKLLAPDFDRKSDLAAHSREVSAIAQRFAQVLELPAAQVETVRLAALVHDVGMRMLDYDRLYKRPQLMADEIRGLAEHPVVGAALVEPLLGPEVAQAVLRHHERVDGKGYPSRLSGASIPIGSRIIQICDAWVAMTSDDSYRTPTTRADAIARLKEGAGSQFDREMVGRFLAALPQITGS